MACFEERMDREIVIMNILEKDILYYVSRLKNRQYFAFPGYSDAEWYCMMGLRAGGTTGLGQTISVKHGSKLTDVMKRRYLDKNWLFAVPKVLPTLPLFTEYPIDTFLKENGFPDDITFYERDMVLDDLAKNAGLYPLIKQLQKMDSILIGPTDLKELEFLDYKRHVVIESPNLHMSTNGISNAVEEVVRKSNIPNGIVCLVSAGVSAPVIIDRLYSLNPSAFYIDCGSIWDAFVGIGGQREWRARLYRSPEKLKQWRDKNLYGI